MKTLACRDFGLECDFVGKGATDDEVMRLTSEHVKKQHPERWNKTKNMNPTEQAKMMLPKIKEM